MWSNRGQKFINDYYVEKYMREYEARKLTKKEAIKRLNDAGIPTHNGGMGCIGYRSVNSSGVLFGTDPITIDRVITEHKKASKETFAPHDPIVLKDTQKDLWNWFKRG